MKFIYLGMLFIFKLTLAQAKPPENPDVYLCKGGSKPVFLSQTKDALVIGICGVKDDAEANNFMDFKVQILSGKKKNQKIIFSDSSMNKKFLVLDKRDGLLLIEKIKVDQEFVEIFRHDIVCDKKSCQMKKEICVILNKVKQKWIKENLKDSQIKSRMKKTGC